MPEDQEKIIQLSESQHPFSKYPEEINNVFKETEVVIPAFPSFLDPLFIEPAFSDTKLVSLDQLENYLQSESDFWQNPDWQNKLGLWGIIGNLIQTKNCLENCKRSIERNELTPAKNHLKESFKYLALTLHSKTLLAQTLWGFRSKSASFFNGFFKVASKNPKTNSFSYNEFEGAFSACLYARSLEPLFSSSQLERLKGDVDGVCERYADLNARYLESFQEQEARLAEIAEANNRHIQDLTNRSNEFWEESNKRRDELESIYREKLRLEAPAAHWDTMAEKYKSKGNVWLGGSVVLAVLILGALAYFLWEMPLPEPNQSSWVGIVRNYLILTATVGVGFYMLRLSVRMCMSSYHQSRDAEERSKLAGFYLSLSEKGVVSDKERALVINSLFSRTDTGLLQGDSSPVMSQNVTELVNVVAKK